MNARKEETIIITLTVEEADMVMTALHDLYQNSASGSRYSQLSKEMNQELSNVLYPRGEEDEENNG